MWPRHTSTEASGITDCAGDDHLWRHGARQMQGGAVGFSYRTSFKAGPIRITASKSGISYSAGVKGARITRRADGRVQTTLSAPAGTGMRHTTTRSGKGNAAGRQKGKGWQAAPGSALLPGHRSSALPYPPPAGTPRLAFKGYLARVTLRPDRIQIDRTFLGRVNGSHSASIPWQQLAGVDFLDPTRLVNGHVHFATATDPRADSGRPRQPDACSGPEPARDHVHMAAASHL
jgi:hypothetical protein